jgi:5-methylcytosine-specific restriction endonuclease McrA
MAYKDPADALAYQRSYNERTDYNRRYYLAHRDKWSQAKRSVKENDTGKKYRVMVNNLLLERDGPICSLCGELLEPEKEVLHIDHIRPRCMGGGHEAKNIRLVHATCNLVRGKKLMEEEVSQ